MKAWLKGGLIGGGIILVYNLIFLILISSNIYLRNLFFITYPLKFFANFFYWIYIFGEWNYYFQIFILLPVFYFLVGALVGFVVGKIKSRRPQ